MKWFKKNKKKEQAGSCIICDKPNVNDEQYKLLSRVVGNNLHYWAICEKHTLIFIDLLRAIIKVEEKRRENEE